MELKEILNKLNIDYYEREYSEDEILYYCMLFVDKELSDKLPMFIVEDFKNKFLVIKSISLNINLKKKSEILEVLNDINSSCLYGSVYLNEDVVSFDIFIAITRNKKYKYNIIKSYIEEYIKIFMLLLDKLNEYELINKDDKEE
ncbi:hypothetical protein ACSXDI_06210 [Clostridium perfringens]|uniref:hypothetical protein n=1 Tax=Clostridium perfringens TaxID=1502 RepID=UPI001A336DD5|nr:hypothetical protein [Clostridium perfringens]